jgi:hypothetical protein
MFVHDQWIPWQLLFAADLNVHLHPNMDKKGGQKATPSHYAERFEEYSIVNICED